MVVCRCSSDHAFHKNTKNISFKAYLWGHGGAAGLNDKSILWIVDIESSRLVYLEEA